LLVNYIKPYRQLVQKSGDVPSVEKNVGIDDERRKYRQKVKVGNGMKASRRKIMFTLEE